MNKVAKMIMQAKMLDREDDFERGQGGRRDRENWDSRDREDRENWDSRRDRENWDSRDNRDRRRDFDDMENDGRRGVKDSGRYSRMRDRHSVNLSKSDIKYWEKNLKNADGTRGPHFSKEVVMESADKLGIRFDEYSEKEFCATMNMLYSDLCEVNRSMVSPDKEAHYYAKLAQAWLEDDDGPEGSEKLALYFYCIADDE